jgi:hypothetical protein
MLDRGEVITVTLTIFGTNKNYTKADSTQKPTSPKTQVGETVIKSKG